MKPLVTIAIPSFNAERWLRACVESALAQTWPAKEVIVVDDGSSDASLSILRSFGGAIRVFETPHCGAPHARNQALAAASGEWVQFLDADDYLEPPKIAAQLAEGAGAPEAEVLYSQAIVEKWSNDRAEGRVIDSVNPALDLYEQWLAFQLPQTGAALWKAGALRRIGGWNESMPCCQDTELYLRALQAGLRFFATASSHAVYRIWSEATLCRKNPLQVIEIRTRLIQELTRWLRETGRLKLQHSRAAGQACFEMARTFARHDLDGAAAYFEQRRAEGLLTLSGPAAPAHYRLTCRLLGFRNAERLAMMQRR